MRFLALIVFSILCCKPSVVSQNFHLTIKAQNNEAHENQLQDNKVQDNKVQDNKVQDTRVNDSIPISSAQIYIDNKLVGMSDEFGRWSGRIDFAARSKHKLSIKADPSGGEFAEWERNFDAETGTIELTAHLESEKLPTHTFASNEIESKDAGQNLASTGAEQVPEVDKTSFSYMVKLWRSSYTKFVPSLPPVMPAPIRLSSPSKQPPKPQSLEPVKPQTFIPTIYVRSGPIGLSGVEIWTSKPELKAICSTNLKGRCSPEVPIDIGSVLIRKKGFRSVSLQIKGEGTYQIQIEPGQSKDIWIKSGDSSWIVRQSGLEVTRGTGDSFVVIDRFSQDISVDAFGVRGSVPKIVEDSEEVVEVDMGDSSRDRELYVEQPGFIGDYEGDLTTSFKQVSRELEIVLEKMRFRKNTDPNSAKRSLQVNLVKSGPEHLVEAKIIGAGALNASFGLSVCQNGFKICLRQSIEKALRLQDINPTDSASTPLSHNALASKSPPKDHSVDVSASNSDKRSSDKRSPDNKLDENQFVQPDVQFTIQDANQGKIPDARVYIDGSFVGFSDHEGRFTIPSLTGNSIEILKEGQSFYRGYWAASEKSRSITLLVGSVAISGETENGVGLVRRDQKLIGQLPGHLAVQPSKIVIDGGAPFKPIQLQIQAGHKVDLGTIRFHQDLMTEWNQKLSEGDFLGAEKVMKNVQTDHPDYIHFAYLLREKEWVETGKLYDQNDNELLKNYLSYRLLFAKSNGLALLNSGNPMEIRQFIGSISDILPLALSGPYADFIYEIHYYKALAELRTAAILKDPEMLKVSLSKVNQWLESDLAGKLPSEGKKMWDLARNDFINQKRKVL